jgi:hypothetical protein
LASCNVDEDAASASVSSVESFGVESTELIDFGSLLTDKVLGLNVRSSDNGAEKEKRRAAQ